MPGFELTRFVDLSKTEEDELSCGICFSIFIKPLVTPCCRLTYCEECISEWLKKNSTCPNDRQHLKFVNMIEAPRLVHNMLDKLLIRCNFMDKGCTKVSTLEMLSSHLNLCRYNPDGDCCECGCKNGEIGVHNCLANLLDVVKRKELELHQNIQTINLLQNDMKAFKKYCNNLDSNVQKLYQENRRLNRSKIGLKSENTKIKSQLKKLTENNNLLKNEIVKLKDLCKNPPFNSMVQQLTDDNQTLTQSNNNLKRESEILKTRIENYISIIHSHQQIISNNSNIKSNGNPLEPVVDAKSNTTLNEDLSCDSDLIVNYFNLNLKPNVQITPLYQMKYEAKVIQIDNKSVLVIKYSADDIQAFNLMLHLMTINIILFKNNPSNDLNSNSNLSNKWAIVSNDMISSGYKDWTPQKCRDSFFNCITLYKEVLTNAPNYEAAYTVYPLFGSLHSLDFKHFLKTKSLNKLIDLLFKFALRINTKSCITTNENLGQNIKPNEILLPSTSADTNCQQLIDSNQKLTEISETQNNTNHINMKTQLKAKTSKLTERDVKAFYSMVEIINTFTAKFGNINENSWPIISFQMIQIGYQDFDFKICRNKFQDYVCDYYKMTLISCPNFKTAFSVYPLFELIHSMDLSKALSNTTFNEIEILRKKFDKRCTDKKSFPTS